MKGELFIVATPIGNLDEVSKRTLDTLNKVDIIACEDTNHSLILLNHFNIKKPLIAYHKFNEKKQAPSIIKKLEEGRNIALITDAGMPCISDPGVELINQAIKNEIKYTVISGPSAAVNAVVLSGMGSGYCFIGFLPEKKKDKVELVNRYLDIPCPLVFYSAPHDLIKNLEFLNETLGNRRVAVIKEISKIHESVEFMNLQEKYNKEPKGEYALVVEGKEKEEDIYSNLSIEEHLEELIKEGKTEKEAIKEVAKSKGLNKNEVYQVVVQRKNR